MRATKFLVSIVHEDPNVTGNMCEIEPKDAEKKRKTLFLTEFKCRTTSFLKGERSRGQEF